MNESIAPIQSLPPENEMKLYLLIRSDVPVKASELVPAMGNAFKTHMDLSASKEEWAERNNFYFHIQPAYPKICKRYKAKNIKKLDADIETLTIPCVAIVVNNENVGYIVGPAYRHELPKNMDSLQLMQECMVEIDESENTGNVEIGYRNDIEIPAGKLIPQFGHAIQKFWCENTEASDALFSVKGKSLQTIQAEGNYITDAGRTFFTQPTVTTNFWIK